MITIIITILIDFNCRISKKVNRNQFSTNLRLKAAPKWGKKWTLFCRK